MNRDLFLAILSMDSYNRGYGARVNVDGVNLGNADLIPRELLGITPSQYQTWQSVGFLRPCL